MSLVEKIFRYPGILVGLFFLAVELFICPTGEFPLNDDWAYALCVRNYVNDGVFHFSFWQAIPDLPSIFLGIVTCKIFGFSFVGLRSTSILLTFLAILLLGHSLGKYQKNKKNVFLILVVFAFNPLVFNLSNTFMPESMLTFLSICCIHFILLYINKQSKISLMFVSIFCVFAVLSRQSALIIPLSFSIACFFLKRSEAEKWLSLIPLIASILALKLFEITCNAQQLLPENYGLQINSIIYQIGHPNTLLILKLAYYFTNSIVCLGLLLLPLSICFFNEAYIQIRSVLKLKILFAVLLLVVGLKLVLAPATDPFTGNMFYQGGLGPVIMTGFNSDEIQNNSLAVLIANIFLNFAGIISIFIVILKLKINSLSETQKYFTVFTVTLSALYLAAISFNYANDRYLVFLVPFILAAILQQTPLTISRLKFGIPFTLLSLYAILGTHDYLEVHKQRKNATTYFEQVKHISPCEIDGGFEYNAWHCSTSGKYDPDHKGRWWWVNDVDHVVAAEKQDQDEVIAAFEVFQFLRPNLRIYCLQKKHGE